MKLLIIIIVLLVVGTGIYLYSKSRANKKEPKPKPPEPPEPPKPEYKTVAEDLRVYTIKQKTGKPFILVNLFVPELLYSERITDEIVEELFDTFCEKEVGNACRAFMLSNHWAWKYSNWNSNPLLINNKGKFRLPDPEYAYETMSEYINPTFEENMIKRIQQVTKRKILFIDSLVDECGFHSKENAAWGSHWLNPANNTINTSPNRHAYYLYTENPDDVQMQNTGKIIKAMIRYMLERIWNSLDAEQRKYFAVEVVNEGHAGEKFHIEIDEIINETLGENFPRWKRFTSTYRDDITPGIRQGFTPVIHQIGTLDRYKERVPSYQCGVSNDGFTVYGEGNVRIPVQPPASVQLLEKTYNDGNVLYETSDGHRHEDVRLPGGKKNTTAYKHWYDFSATEWDNMKKLGNKLLNLVSKGGK